MLRNYFKIAWRNILHNKLYTAANTLGLSLGICSCIVIYLITSYEMSFDVFHADKDRIYRVMGDVTESTGDKLHFARVPLALSQNGRKELSGLDAIAGLIPYNTKISVPNGSLPAKHFDSRMEGTRFITTAITEYQYFTIFHYDWLAGSAQHNPFTVVLTESRARKYFGPGPLDGMIGRQLVYGDSLLVTVSGIIKDWEGNTDLGFTDFISFSTLHDSFLKNNINTDSWKENAMSTWTFFKHSKGTTPGQVNAQLAALLKRHAGPEIKLSLWLEPLTNIHFNDDIIENSIRTAHRPTLYGLMLIAAFILIIAIINFINLSTAQSIQRAKEVGVRKVLGGSRKSLMFQFLSETFLLTFLAVLLAILFVNPVLSWFHSFIPDGVSFTVLDQSTLFFLVFILLLTSLLAGLYPANVLSSYLPAFNLKGIGQQRGGEKWLLRKGLIIFQFSASLAFIIASLVIANQLRYTREKNLGFTTDAIITVETPRGDSFSKINVLAEKIKQIPGVNNVALQWLSPMTENSRGMKLKFKSTDEKDTWVTQVAGNENFIPLYGIKLLAGRNLAPTDSVKEFVINETLAGFIGSKKPEDAIGKILYWNDKPYPVVGVVADFHTSSLHDPITPLCIINRPERQGSLAIKLASGPGQTNATLVQIEKNWKQLYPAATFNYQFYDESLALLYKKDRQTATLTNTSMIITIFISCMGLFGLALFMAQKRAKEISIRKVLGASLANIAIMLSKDFIILVIIAFFVASPIAWYFMNQWLQGFAYRIHITGWIFILAGIIAVLIALITVSWQAVKAALANPVDSLKIN
jgi:putative ABC transport system permease protein